MITLTLNKLSTPRPRVRVGVTKLNSKANKMTQSQFLIACNEVGVTPEIALENDLIVQALKDRDYALVIELLLNQF